MTTTNRKVYLEVLPSLAETLGIDKTSEVAIPDLEEDGVGSIGDLLNQLCVSFERFGQLVFNVNTQELTGRVVIFINGCSLELANGLDTRLSNGDTLSFVPLIEGG